MRIWLWLLVPLLMLGCSATRRVEPPSPDPAQPPPPPLMAAEKISTPAETVILPPTTSDLSPKGCAEADSAADRVPRVGLQLTFLCEGKLWAHDLSTGARRLLYDPPGGMQSYTWRPTGEGFVFVTGDSTRAVYRDMLTGADRTLFAQAGGEPIMHSWSPDGSILLISPGCCKGREYIFVDLASGKEIGRSNGWRFLWSPDSSRLAVDRMVDAGAPVEGGGSSSSFVLEFRDGRMTEIPLFTGGKQAGYAFHSFEPDGTLIGTVYEAGTFRTTGWWSLPPAAERPVMIASDSAQVARAEARAAAPRPIPPGPREQAQWFPAQAANPDAWRAVLQAIQALSDPGTLQKLVVPEGLVVAPAAVGAPETGLTGDSLAKLLSDLSGRAKPVLKAFRISPPDRVDMLIEGLPAVEVKPPTGGLLKTTDPMKAVLRREVDGNWRLWMLVVDRDGALEAEACSGEWVWTAPVPPPCSGKER